MEEIDEALECLSALRGKLISTSKDLNIDIESDTIQDNGQLSLGMFLGLNLIYKQAEDILYQWAETDFVDGPEIDIKTLPTLEDIRDSIDSCQLWFDQFEGPSTKSALKNHS